MGGKYTHCFTLKIRSNDIESSKRVFTPLIETCSEYKFQVEKTGMCFHWYRLSLKDRRTDGWTGHLQELLYALNWQSYCFQVSAWLCCHYQSDVANLLPWFNFRRVQPKSANYFTLVIDFCLCWTSYLAEHGKLWEVFKCLQSANVEADQFEFDKLLKISLVIFWKSLNRCFVQNQIVKLMIEFQSRRIDRVR